MNWWIIIGIVVAAFFVWAWLSDYKEKMLRKAVDDTEKEYDLNNQIIEVKQMLSKKKFGSKIMESLIEEYNFEKDRSVGACPKCKIGYLHIEKRFTGLDDKYNRYPTYDKYLKCTKCIYTENYSNVKNRKNEVKEGITMQFVEDFNKAYLL